MTGFLRRAGRGVAPDGAAILWSVAEGTRGRRWRIAESRDGSLEQTVLLEIGRDGRLVKLEVAAGEGMLTVHPDRGGTVLHGNVVTRGGMRHIRDAWSEAHLLVLDGQPLVAAIQAHGSAGGVGKGVARATPVVRIDRALGVSQADGRLTQGSEGRWRLEVGGTTEEARLDADGLPAGLDDAETWPLEED
jgi:hypothetical protein